MAGKGHKLDQREFFRRFLNTPGFDLIEPYVVTDWLLQRGITTAAEIQLVNHEVTSQRKLLVKIRPLCILRTVPYFYQILFFLIK